MVKQVALPSSLPPFLVNREQAAACLCVSATKFDELVKTNRMPRPRAVDAKRLWLVSELMTAAFALPMVGEETVEDDGWGDVDRGGARTQ